MSTRKALLWQKPVMIANFNGVASLHQLSMRMRAVVFLALVLGGCASLPRAAPDAARYQLDRLYFGRAIADTGMVSDSAWAVFVREVVTTRFPAGITFWRGEGQWRSSTGTVVREPSMVLEVIHVPSQSAEDALHAVILEYERRFLQESVLRVTTDVSAQFQLPASPRR